VRSQPVVASLHAVDASGEEGLIADAQVCAELDCRAAAVPTGLLAVKPEGRLVIDAAPTRWLDGAFACLLAGAKLSAARIGFLANAMQVELAADRLHAHGLSRLVCAPLMKLAGQRATDDGTLAAIRDRLFPMADVVVVRAGDLDLLGGASSDDLGAVKVSTATLRAEGARSVLVAGLGWRGRVLDLLDEEGAVTVLDVARLNVPRIDGLAGAHAMALACHLARGLTLGEAAAAAQRYVGLRLQRGR